MVIRSNININKLKRQVFSHVKIIRIIILSLILGLTLSIGIITYRALAKSVIGTYVGLARDFIIPTTSRIKINNGRINVLIMGKGGGGHDAPDLTDTMILASISTVTAKMTLISIPRDIWIPSLKDKINSAYMYGKLVLAKSVLEEVTGTQISYAIVLDFDGFKDVIDALNGVDVEVKTGFIDTQYPIEGHENDPCLKCRYETITFEEGSQTMNGETALKFVRSRHATGVEGNDVAREARQQLVISAIVKKAITPQIFTNLTIDKNLLKIAQNNIETDLKPSEMATLTRYLVDAKNNMKSYTIPENLLYNPPNEYKYFNSLYTHAFVFIPNNKQSLLSGGKTEDWSDVQNWVRSILP